METMQVAIVFTDEILGTASADPALYEEFIANKGPSPEKAKEEVATLPDVAKELQKATTVFHRTEDDKPFLMPYQIKGFFKDACGVLRRVTTLKMKRDGKEVVVRKGTLSSKLTAFKKVIDGLIFVKPERILFELPDGVKMNWCVRPLRAQTAQGERIALARSETIPAGSKLTFTVIFVDNQLMKLVEEWLEYASLRGLGQWRNSGKGRFTYQIVTD